LVVGGAIRAQRSSADQRLRLGGREDDEVPIVGQRLRERWRVGLNRRGHRLGPKTHHRQLGLVTTHQSHLPVEFGGLLLEQFRGQWPARVEPDGG